MSEPFDITLKNRIIEVFDNYDDNAADEGWALLRQKYPEKKRDRGVMWWFSAAAGLLVFMGIFWLLKPDTKTLTYKSPIKTKSLSTTLSGPTTDTVRLANKAPSVNANKVIAAPTIASQSRRSKTKFLTEQVTDNVRSINDQTAFKKPVIRAQTESPSLQDKAVGNFAGKPDSLKSGIFVAGTAGAKTKVTDSLARENSIAAGLNPKLAERVTDPVLQMMAYDKKQQVKVISATKNDKKQNSVVLSPYAATYFNYAKGSSAQVNVGAGITTDFKISSNFKLSTGISVAQNTLSYDNASAPLTLVSAAASDAPISFNTANATFLGTSTVRSYKANLIGLDVPVNVKYQLNPAKSDTYISAGISSGTFINETYSSSIQTGIANAVTNNQTSSSSHFGTFDFARTLNLSFGLGYPIGKNRIIVEPFIKYPLGGLGSQNLQFGASGINFKLNLGKK